jgi:hypothetical protein
VRFRRTLLLVTAVVLTTTGAARGAETPAWHLATSLSAGAMTPDRSLADYRWDTRPTSLFSVQALAVRGRVAGGLRMSRWSTTQGTGLQDVVGDPTVRMTQYDLVGQVRVVDFLGFELWGTVMGGLVGLAYTPDQVVIPGAGPGGDITVDYAPVNETSLGIGLEIKRELARWLAASLVAEQSRFSLDTYHRRGDEIVAERQAFANWSLRLQVSWILDLG